MKWYNQPDPNNDTTFNSIVVDQVREREHAQNDNNLTLKRTSWSSTIQGFKTKGTSTTLESELGRKHKEGKPYTEEDSGEIQ